MNFVITKDGYVQLGPNVWNKHVFESELQDLGIDIVLPPTNKDFMSLSDSIKIYPISGITVPNYNSKTEQLAGPYYVYSAASAEITYTIVNKSIDLVKSEVKGLVSAQRYALEVAGTTTTLKNTEVRLDTSREGRGNYAQQFLLMADTDTISWKFQSIWLTLSKAELGQCVAAVSAHVQTQFQWEMAKNAEIDACTTLDELNDIVISE